MALGRRPTTFTKIRERGDGSYERHEIEVYKVDLPAAARFGGLLLRHLENKPPVGEAGPDRTLWRPRLLAVMEGFHAVVTSYERRRRLLADGGREPGFFHSAIQ
jgi:hypothetical protein